MQLDCNSFVASTENSSATEQATEPDLRRHDKMIGPAAEQPTADRAATRHLLTIYSLNPARRPDAHTVLCIMLHKGLLTDDDLRAFIEQHINTAIVPEGTIGPDEHLHTYNFVIRTSASPLPALCEQLRDYCSRPQATRFQEPLLDGAGYTIGFLSMTQHDWEHSREITDKLGEAILQSSEQCYSGNMLQHAEQ